MLRGRPAVPPARRLCPQLLGGGGPPRGAPGGEGGGAVPEGRAAQTKGAPARPPSTRCSAVAPRFGCGSGAPSACPPSIARFLPTDARSRRRGGRRGNLFLRVSPGRCRRQGDVPAPGWVLCASSPHGWGGGARLCSSPRHQPPGADFPSCPAGQQLIISVSIYKKPSLHYLGCQANAFSFHAISFCVLGRYFLHPI